MESRKAAMTDRRRTEVERREAAQAAKGQIEEGAEEPVEPTKLGQMLSLRLSPEIAVALRRIASERNTSVSELLREAAQRLVAESTTPTSVLMYRVTLPATTWGDPPVLSEPSWHPLRAGIRTVAQPQAAEPEAVG